MQADRRLVQHVERIYQAAAQAAGQANSLHLAAGELKGVVAAPLTEVMIARHADAAVVVVLGTEDAVEEVQEEIKEAAAAVSAARVALIGDDLTQIKGVGPTYESRLKEAGFTTYAEVAAADPDVLHEVAKATATADTGEWIAQARELSA